MIKKKVYYASRQYNFFYTEAKTENINQPHADLAINVIWRYKIGRFEQ